MKPLHRLCFTLALLASCACSAQSFNVFQPGGALSGSWNSQDVNLGAGSPYIFGLLPLGNLNPAGNFSPAGTWKYASGALEIAGTSTGVGMQYSENTGATNYTYTWPNANGVVPLIYPGGTVTPGDCTSWNSAVLVQDAGGPCATWTDLPVVQFLKTLPPQASFSYPTPIAGGSTPAEQILANDFPASTATYLDYLCFLQGYHGTGLTLSVSWTSTVTSGNAVLQAAIRRIQSGVTNLTSAFSYSFQPMAAAAPAASVGIPTTSSILLSDGTQMNGVQNGEYFILRLYRNAGSGSDTMGGDFQLLGIQGYAQ